MKPYIPQSLPFNFSNWNWQELALKISKASASLAYYDGILKSIINPGIFLSPLEMKEAVLSSRIEGTATTVDEVLKYEASIQPTDLHRRADIREVLNYRSAMRGARVWLGNEMPFNISMLCAIHNDLMQGVRGEKKRPGELRKEQNWIGPRNCSIEEAYFVPPKPLVIRDHLENLINFLNQNDQEILIQSAIFHAQFEMIHPFLDGNGRTGRIAIPLFLWYKKRISSPTFYISEFFEENRDEYINGLNDISQHNSWERWIKYFLKAINTQANRNAEKAIQVINLYKDMKTRITKISHSPYAINILDTMFSMPVFRKSDFVRNSKIKNTTVYRILNRLKEEKILKMIVPSAGRSSEVLVFDELFDLIK